MESHSFLSSAFANMNVLDALYEKYQTNPDDVDPSLQSLFRTVDNQSIPEKTPVKEPREQGASSSSCKESPPQQGELKISQLINAYRTYGHLLAKINPIQTRPIEEPWQLSLNNIGFDESQLNQQFPTCGLMEQPQASLQEIVDCLKEIYCGNIGVEFMGVQNPELARWLQGKIEPSRFKTNLTIDQKRMILQHLNKSELFESFLHTKFVGQKRFSLEGGETLIPILAAIIHTGNDLGLEHYVVGMAHRGRLNVLSNILNKSYADIFSEFEDRWIANSFEGSGDVKYHKGFTSETKTESGKNVVVELAPNPSHLEAVNPVVEGQVRAKQVMLNNESAADKIIPILIHGDAAVSGQGIIYETLQMYDLDGYSTGGTIHVVINNQIGFTTLPKDARSTRYCTDIARAFNAPVFHVNGEDPEGCVHAANLAVAIRQKFHCDVFIDLYCYRKYGHNETDEPAFTQPLEYQLIRKKKPIREIYRDNLIQQGILEKHMAESLEVDFKEALQVALTGTQLPGKKTPERPDLSTQLKAADENRAEMLRVVKTGATEKNLVAVGEKICTVPDNFNLHRKMKQLHKDRLAMVKGEKPIDWGMGELLAYGSLLADGVHVRLSGQDCGRGTFSHRHALLMDQVQERAYYPLQHIKEGQGRFDVINSLLSEYAVLGFEYGYSLGTPESLILWEAQFGDFANGAQVMIDQFISSSEQKWGQKNNVVMLLPHGYEGQGPEHSSGRIERFLSLCGDNNMFVVNPTTPAQMFHLLRRQVYRRSPKPLIVFTPKALLRHPMCTSTLQDLTQGYFHEVIDDPNPAKKVKQLVFCSGKIYYDLAAEREKRGVTDMAIVRIEQLYPLHRDKIASIVKKYKGCEQFFWVQEEPKNMGAWRALLVPLGKIIPSGKKLEYIGRRTSASTATGSVGRHKQEYEAIMDSLFNAGRQKNKSKSTKGKKK
ncbi:MAG: 2-oxoglutarate dehydrogenase E1 component [Chlamydiota bacterium]|nr:2-oxoglutarate dehydrogenase E1 component [Chlamydiota bacterium]